VVLLDKESGVALQGYRGHTHTSFALSSCFTHDDAFVVSGSEDGSVFVWGLVEGEVLQRLEHGSSSGGGGPCPPATAPSVGTLGSAGGGGPSLFLDAAAPSRAAAKKGVVGVAAHPREARLVSTSLDGTAVYWEGTYD
jgi:WD40 repeat protein